MRDVEELGALVYRKVRDMDTDEMPDDVSDKIHRGEAFLREAFDEYEWKKSRGDLE